MSGILRLESLTKGNTLRQGDLTLLKYRLFDADGDKLDISGKPATVRLMKNDFTFIAYEKEGLTVAPDDTISFNINKILSGGLYHLEVIVDDKYIFPSRSDEGKFNVDKSSLGVELTIIENEGIDAVVRKAIDLINDDPSLIIDEERLVDEIIANTGIKNIEEYYQSYSDVIKELSETKDYHSLPEIVGARGGFDTLDQRLDETDSQLSQKVGMGTKAELEDLSETVLSAIDGGTGTSFNLLSIPQNNSVSEYKTTFIKATRNLMNPNHLGEGYYNGQGGVSSHAFYYHTTDFPRTNGVKKLSFQPNDTSVTSIVFYDSAKQFISYATNNGVETITTFDVPDGAYYFNVSFYKDTLNRFMIEYGNTQSSYEPYLYQSQIEPNLLTSLIDEGKNLMNPNLLGVGFLGGSGDINDHYLYRYTENYIPTKGHRWLSFQPNRANVVVNIQYYDLNHNRILFNTNDTDKENIKRFQVPENAHYFRISFNASTLGEFMVEYGLHQSDYEPYRKPTLIEPFNNVIGDKEEKDNLSVVCFGDSITATKVETGQDYPSVIREQTGWTVHNVGFGGCRMSRHPSTRYNNFCMHNLAEAVATQDFTAQEADTTGAPHYPDHLNTLKNIDFNEVDVITIAYGTNDWGGGAQPPAPVDNPDDPYDRNNLIGAMRYSIKTLLEAYPHLKILVVTPYYRFETSNGQDSDDGWRPTHNPNHSLQEYVQAEIETAYEMKVPSVDMYNTLGINKYNRTNYFSTTDGVHPQVEGLKLIGKRVANEINLHYA